MLLIETLIDALFEAIFGRPKLLKQTSQTDFSNCLLKLTSQSDSSTTFSDFTLAHKALNGPDSE